MRWVVLVGVLALAGCEKESTRALREAEMVEKTSDNDAKCAAKRKVADAFLHERDEANYQRRKGAADSFCELLRLSRLNGSEPGLTINPRTGFDNTAD